METLESVDLIVSTDEKDLSNFYDTDSAASSESIVSSPHDIDQAQRIESECEEVENEEKT
jgi:hypothetical protein